jgi:hypothetical protein
VTVRRGPALLTLLVVGLAGLPGCTDGSSGPSGEPVSAAPQQSADASSSPRPRRAAVTATRLRWRTVVPSWDLTAGTHARPPVAADQWVALPAPTGDRVEFRPTDGSPGAPVVHDSPSGRRVSDVLLDPPWAVVVDQDKLESRPERATVYDLRSGRPRVVNDSRRAPEPATGSAWDLAEGRLAYITPRGSRFCVALTDVDTLRGEPAVCRPPRHGMNQFVLSDTGLSFAGFHGRPSCAGIVTLRYGGQRPQDLDTGGRCGSWDGALLSDAVVWSRSPDANAIEVSDFFARTDDGAVWDLGRGVTGSLTWCAGHAYFTRNGDDGGSNRLLRWSSGSGLESVLEVPVRRLSLSAPTCGGDSISVSPLGNDGRATAMVAAVG